MLEQRPDDNKIVEPQSVKVPWTIQQTFLGLFLTVVPWLMLSFGLAALEGGTTQTKAAPLSLQTDILSAVLTVLFSMTIQSAFLIAPVYFARRTLKATTGIQPSRRQVLRTLGFRGFQVGRVLRWLVVFLAAIILVNYLYQYLISVFHLNLQTNDQVYLEDSRIAPVTTYAILAMAVFVAPFCEEVFFRGFVFPGLLNGMALGWAIVLSALIFAAVHADVGSFAILAIIGLALAFLRWRTQSILPGMALHILNNAIGAAGILLAMHGVR